MKTAGAPSFSTPVRLAESPRRNHASDARTAAGEKKSEMPGVERQMLGQRLDRLDICQDPGRARGGHRIEHVARQVRRCVTVPAWRAIKMETWPPPAPRSSAPGRVAGRERSLPGASGPRRQRERRFRHRPARAANARLPSRGLCPSIRSVRDASARADGPWAWPCGAALAFSSA